MKQQSMVAAVKWKRGGRGGCWVLAMAIAGIGFGGMAQASDVSAPALLQWFEGSWQTIGNRTGDILAAGYGGVWTPPPGKGDSGTASVGYDVYDRFDLGSPGSPTRYGTEAGLKRMVSMFHQAGVSSYVDLVWNHDGNDDWWSTDNNGNTFLNAGGYPGFYMGTGGTSSGGNWGDFHSPFASGDYDGKISNLVDIDQSTTNMFIRNPVPGYSNNLPAGTVSYYGRGPANVPTNANLQFYPSQSGTPRTLTDSATNGTYTVYNFDPANPMAGTPTAENAVGYLQRNVQWLMQDIGVDGFRLDATKNMPAWVLNYYDVAAFSGSTKTNLDGSTKYAFSFGEYYGSDLGEIQSRIRKDINPATPNTVGGNRDDLDFPLYWAMQSNLTSNGQVNDWRNVVNASVDKNDDGLANNGSQGVSFVQGHDTGIPAPDLANVAYAYTLMRPGNTIVYYNGQEFGSETFPAAGRGDALGGQYGTKITTLVQLRNEYGRGDYQERWIEQNLLGYERKDSALVLLSNRSDAGYDSRTLQTSFPAGTHLVEMTGNATNSADDPFNDIPDTVVVNSDGTVNVRFLRNTAPGTSNFTGDGYLIYAPQNPKGSLSFTNVAQTLAGGTGTTATNGTTRVTSIDVVKTNSFAVTLNTSAVTLSDGYRDKDADGDNALVMMDGGIDLNGNGHVDNTTPGSVVYGFEDFTGTHTSGYSASSGNGVYTQSINTTGLSEGYHYLTIRAFRHRASGEPAIYTDFTQTVYVDRLKPVSAVLSFTTPNGNDRTVTGQSTDETANNIHFFLDLAPNTSDATILGMVSSSSQGSQIDVDQWSKTFSNLASGNHVVTMVTFEMDGNSNVQRFPGYLVAGTRGKGVGDIDWNNAYSSTDMSTFGGLVSSAGGSFNAAADVNGDGKIDLVDAFLMGPALNAAGVNATTNTGGAWTGYLGVINGSYVKSNTLTVPAGTMDVLDVTAGTTTVPSGATLKVTSFNGGAVNVQTGGAVVIKTAANGGKTGKITALTITGKMDLGDQDLVVDYTGTSPAGTVVGYLLSGRAGGAWTGTGLNSSSAAGDGHHITAIGYAEASAILGLTGTQTGTWSGQTVDATSLLLKYTYYGDANLDGVVSNDDYALVDRGMAKHLTGWVNGDFNYDGTINAADYLLIDSAFALQGGTLSASMLAGREAEFGSAYVTDLLAVAPEPGGIVMLGIGLVMIGRRRNAERSGE